MLILIILSRLSLEKNYMKPDPKEERWKEDPYGSKLKIVHFVKEAKMGSIGRQGPSWKEKIVQFVKEAKMGCSERLGPSWKEVISRYD